jgi:phosphoribosylformylglycinamidine synthase
VEDVRAGKIFFLEVDGTEPAAVEAEARRMAEELLANTVIEGFDVRIPTEP